MADSNCYLVVSAAKAAALLGKAGNGSPRPCDRGHGRASLDGTQRILHGTWSDADLAAAIKAGTAVRYDHAGILAYLAANRANWEASEV